MHTLPVPPADLPALLRAGAAGALHIEAAVGLLIDDRYWLEHPWFRENCVIHDPELAPDVAGIDWPACGRLEIPASDIIHGAVLLIAGELAGYDCGQPFVDLLAGVALDDPTARRVLRALGIALGFHLDDTDDEPGAGGQGDERDGGVR